MKTVAVAAPRSNRPYIFTQEPLPERHLQFRTATLSSNAAVSGLAIALFEVQRGGLMTRMESIGMQTSTSKLALAVTSVGILAGAYRLPAAAAEQNSYIRHRVVHRPHRPVDNGDITVRTGAHRESVAAAPDAFHGPAAIITAPVAIAGTLVSLPFRFVEAIFPSRTNDPRVLVGAPVHFAGQIAEFPFFAVNGAFGVPGYY
jgi:hypothetical protein